MDHFMVLVTELETLDCLIVSMLNDVVLLTDAVVPTIVGILKPTLTPMVTASPMLVLSLKLDETIFVFVKSFANMPLRLTVPPLII